MSTVAALFLVATFSVIHWQVSPSLQGSGLDLGELGRALFKPKNNVYNFNFWTDKLNQQYLALQTSKDARFWQYTLGGDNLHEVLAEDISLHKLDLGLSVFDPRYTLGLVVANLSRQLSAGVSPAQLSLGVFHWADWVDCGVHQQAMATHDPATCEAFRVQGQPGTSAQKDVIHDPYTFCFDSTKLGQEAEAKARKQHDFVSLDAATKAGAISAGFHVFKNPGRTTLAVKKALSTAYLYDFMPTPAGVVLLGASPAHEADPFSVFVSCNVTRRLRLAADPMALEAAQKGLLSLEAELTKFVAALKQPSAASSAPESPAQTCVHHVPLVHDDFVDKSALIAEQLTHSRLSGTLSPREERYLDGLLMSLSTRNPSKYFQEARLVRRERNWILGGHYDWRFFQGLRFNTDVHAPILHGLILAWLRFTRAQKVRTWLAHGTLLGWFWSGTLFPWDADIDVQMPIADLHHLARNFNQTIVVDFGAAPQHELRMGRYFLDIGPWLLHRGPETGQNSIDARFIDMDLGLYIDITALAVSGVASPQRYGLPGQESKDTGTKKALKDNADGQNEQAQQGELLAVYEENARANLYNCRNKHFSSLGELSPLVETYMEGVPAFVPGRFLDILQTEYSESSTSQMRFKAYSFLPRVRMWVKAQLISKYLQQKSKAGLDSPTSLELNIERLLGNQISEARVATDSTSMGFTDEDYLLLMAMEPGLLKEYLATRDYTSVHEKEMRYFLEHGSLACPDDYFEQLHVPEQSMRRDLSGFLRAQNEWRYEEAQAQLEQQFKDRASEAANELPGEPARGPTSGGIQKLSNKASVPSEREDFAEDAKQLQDDPSLADHESRFLKQSEEQAQDPLITRPDKKEYD